MILLEVLIAEFIFIQYNDKGASIRSHVIDGKHTPSIKFVTRNEWYTNEETRMFIRQDGNVGIGTDIQMQN